MGPDGDVQTLSVNLYDDITMQQIADYMGFRWRMSDSDLSVDNATLQYSSSAGGDTLAVSATFGFPTIAFLGNANLQIVGPSSMIFSVGGTSIAKRNCQECFWQGCLITLYNVCCRSRIVLRSFQELSSIRKANQLGFSLQFQTAPLLDWLMRKVSAPVFAANA